MKKFSLIMCLVLLIASVFTFSACDEKENGITIKYATLSISYTDEEGTAKNEDVTLKLYVNYAPETIARFISLANEGFYNDTIVNSVENAWISLGGYKLTNNELEKITSGNTIEGEFYKAGWQGNNLTVSAGSVVMYREPSNIDGNNYDTADCRFAICKDSAAPFASTEYCVIGKLADSDQISVIEDIIKLRSKTENDVTEYKRYYVGGVETIAQKFIDNESLADEKGVEIEDAQKLVEGGSLYRTAGYIDDTDYDEYIAVANNIITAYGSKTYAYFYALPYNNVTLKSVTVSNKK